MTFWVMKRQQKQTSNQSSNQMTLFARQTEEKPASRASRYNRDLRRDGSDNVTNFAYLTSKNRSFARSFRAFLFLYISFPFSAHLRLESIISLV